VGGRLSGSTRWHGAGSEAEIKVKIECRLRNSPVMPAAMIGPWQCARRLCAATGV